MSQGTLYTFPTPRSEVIVALIKNFKLDIDIKVGAESEEFATYFPLKKCPAFVGPKGFKLTETIAIFYYVLNLVEDEKVRASLLGKNNKEQSSILRWMCFGNGDLVSNAITYYINVLNMVPYNKKVCENAIAGFNKNADIVEQRLKEYTYLEGERITAADVLCGSVYCFVFSSIAGADWRKAYPATTRWFNTVTKTGPLAVVYSDFKPLEKKLEFVPPKKEKKEKTAAAKKPEAAAKKPEAASEEPAEPKKAKHPLEALGKATFQLDEWKRQYSNSDTRPVALPWFWEHYNPEEYSIWKVSYKYNEELTLTFMSNNLIGGFINRLSGSVKYMFGCMVVYGENNNNGITGAMLVRGQDFKPAFEVAPDWESYAFEKLDVSTEEGKEFVNNMWAWDKPVVVDGEAKEIADGKVLK